MSVVSGESDTTLHMPDHAGQAVIVKTSLTCPQPARALLMTLKMGTSHEAVVHASA